ncbi:Glucose-1-phosphate adenylyltransferase [bioreactor metagenome]|uniref:Glucose-1-phosphate adenylyltransferase n=1 Tax=bioreactor metagenome TaxID=1076179 RepID=A0A645GKJ1_9ZZZZ
MCAHRFSGYWKDVGTIDSLWDANMDMLSVTGGINIYDTRWPVYTRSPNRPPHVTGPEANISHSMVTGGCRVDGTVENSVLFHSVQVEPGALVRYSILMPGAVVRAGARVEYAILAERAEAGAGACVGTPPDGGSAWGISVVGADVRVPAGAMVPPGAMVSSDQQGGGARE